MSSLLVFDRVYRLENGDTAVILVFSNPALWTAPLTFSLVHLPLSPPFPKSKYSIFDSVWLGEGGRELSCFGDHILQEFNTLFLTRFQNLQNCHPKQKPLRGRGGALRQILVNTLRKVPLQVHLALLSINLSTCGIFLLTTTFVIFVTYEGFCEFLACGNSVWPPPTSAPLPHTQIVPLAVLKYIQHISKVCLFTIHVFFIIQHQDLEILPYFRCCAAIMFDRWSCIHCKWRSGENPI